MQKAVIFFLLIFLAEPSFAQTIDQPVKINATWNDSSPGLIGFWLYSKNGSCTELRGGENLPLVFGFKTRSKSPNETIDVSQMTHCFQLPEKTHLDNMEKCVTGHVQLSFSNATNHYSGNCSLTFNDGKTSNGKFEAEFCPPAKPAN